MKNNSSLGNKQVSKHLKNQPNNPVKKMNATKKSAVYSEKDVPTSIRLSKVQQEKLTQASELSGISKSDLIKTGIEKYIEVVIEEAINKYPEKKYVVLNNDNFKRFTEALANAPKPTTALIELLSD